MDNKPKSQPLALTTTIETLNLTLTLHPPKP